jgi:hypothetical protein
MSSDYSPFPQGPPIICRDEPAAPDKPDPDPEQPDPDEPLETDADQETNHESD